MRMCILIDPVYLSSAAFRLLQESDGGRMFYAKSASEVELFLKKYSVK